MSDPIGATRASYDEIAATFQERTSDPTVGRPWLDRFSERLGRGARVADLGSGPGRDAAELRSRGLDVYCLDLSMGMLRAGVDRYAGRRVQADLRALPLASASLEGAWANASLLHLSERDFPAALGEIARVLVPGGALHLTLKRGEGTEIETRRYGRPRWFQYWQPDPLDAALATAGFAILDAQSRQREETWLVRLCALATPAAP